MSIIDPIKIKLKVGLEIHQQLSTKNKLFCKCPNIEDDTADYKFERNLRPTQSELGQIDNAAIFESTKNFNVRYCGANNSSCLVEVDDEPPREINMEALDSVILIAQALGSNIVDEVHVMRKIVIDGSNTTGFQRTMIVAIGGNLTVEKLNIEVDSITLEEDAARLISSNDNVKEYNLDRLGIPLIEITLKPFVASPKQIEDIALSIGRLMRLTNRVSRGIGTIRQDLNISVMNGPVVEIKGIQKLDQLSKVTNYEMCRQTGLIELSKIIHDKKLNIKNSVGELKDISSLFKNSQSSIINKTLNNDGKIFGIKLIGFKGILSYEPYDNVRFGLELSNLVKLYGYGGIFHSDELPNYGITKNIVVEINNKLGSSKNDAFILLCGNEKNLNQVYMSIKNRVYSMVDGVIPETRAVTRDGYTKFIRPRPGSARLYPETDIPSLSISKNMLKSSSDLPKSWDEEINFYVEKYCLNKKLIIQLLDSQYLDVFKHIMFSTSLNSNYVAATLTENLVNINRSGFMAYNIDLNLLKEIFVQIDQGKISKELFDEIIICSIKYNFTSLDKIISKLNITQLTENQLNVLISSIISKNMIIITEKQNRAFPILMGLIMKEIRGNADGKLVGLILKKSLSVLLNK